MNAKTKLVTLWQAVEMADFRADLALYSPESYTTEETARICRDLLDSRRALVDAMREGFMGLPAARRAKVLDGLCRSGTQTPQWWWDTLVGDGGPLYHLMGAQPPAADALAAWERQTMPGEDEDDGTLTARVEMGPRHRAVLEELGLPLPEEWAEMSEGQLDEEYRAIEDEMVRIVPLDQEKPTEREDTCAEILMALEQVR